MAKKEIVKVEDAYDLDDFLYTKSQEESTDYWDNSYTFFQEVKDKCVDSLTAKQLVWLNKLEESMEEELA